MSATQSTKDDVGGTNKSRLEEKANRATLPQAAQILNLISQQAPSIAQIEGLIESGLLSDLLQCDWTQWNPDLRDSVGLALKILPYRKLAGPFPLEVSHANRPKELLEEWLKKGLSFLRKSDPVVEELLGIEEKLGLGKGCQSFRPSKGYYLFEITRPISRKGLIKFFGLSDFRIALFREILAFSDLIDGKFEELSNVISERKSIDLIAFDEAVKFKDRTWVTKWSYEKKDNQSLLDGTPEGLCLMEKSRLMYKGTLVLASHYPESDW